MKLSNISVAAAFILLTSAALVGVNTGNSASAWKVGHGASAYCNDDAKISFNWSFQNKEANDSKWDIDLTVTDSNTKKSEGPITVKATESATGQIDTDLTEVADGKVSFEMKWSDGRSGVDTRQVSYDTLECEQPNRDIEVCRDGKTITIPVSEKKKTDNPGECPTPEEPSEPEEPEVPNTPEEPKTVDICRDGVEMTVSEDKVLDSDIEGDCPQTLGTNTDSLPKTGASEFVTVVLATGTVLSAAYGHKRGKQQ